MGAAPLTRQITGVKNRIKALCRRRGMIEGLYRQLDLMRRERVGAHRVLGRLTRMMPLIGQQGTIPGVGPVTARAGSQ
jgi:hypothetical protein